MTSGAATAKEKRNAVESQFIAVSETSKYVAADVETGANVNHYECQFSTYKEHGFLLATYVPADHNVQEYELCKTKPSSFVHFEVRVTVCLFWLWSPEEAPPSF